MEKKDILEISRREHQNRDLAELEASVQAGNLAGRVGAGVCCLVSALFVRPSIRCCSAPGSFISVFSVRTRW